MIQFAPLNFYGHPWYPASVVAERLARSQYLVNRVGGAPETVYGGTNDRYVRQALDQGRLPFHPIQTFLLPDGSRSLVYRRTNGAGGGMERIGERDP